MTDTKAWPWMLFKVAGGTILAQAGPMSGETFLIRNLTELKIVDPAKDIRIWWHEANWEAKA